MVIFLTDDRQVSANISGSATLSFRIDNAVPSVSISDIHWYYTTDLNFEDVNFTSSHIQDITNLTNRTSKSILTFSDDLLTLTISNIVHDIKEEGGETDSGRYFLRAINSEGENSSFIDLIILTSPLIVVSPQDQFTTVNNSVLFECNAIANPQHNISWSFRNFSGFIFNNIANTENVTGDKYHVDRTNAGFGDLTIDNVTFADHGTYTCIASNAYGMNNFSANLTVHGRSDIMVSVNQCQMHTLYLQALYITFFEPLAILLPAIS